MLVDSAWNNDLFSYPVLILSSSFFSNWWVTTASKTMDSTSSLSPTDMNPTFRPRNIYVKSGNKNLQTWDFLVNSSMPLSVKWGLTGLVTVIQISCWHSWSTTHIWCSWGQTSPCACIWVEVSRLEFPKSSPWTASERWSAAYFPQDYQTPQHPHHHSCTGSRAS